MSVRKNAQRGTWIAQVQVQGRRASRTCRTEAEAKRADAALLLGLQQTARAEATAGREPVTVRVAFTAYLYDLERRGGAPESIARARDTEKRVEEFLGARMDEPVQVLSELLYAFREWRITHPVARRSRRCPSKKVR